MHVDLYPFLGYYKNRSAKRDGAIDNIRGEELVMQNRARLLPLLGT